MKYYVIAGGAGFIGTNLIKRLLDDGDNAIFVLDDLSSGTTRNIENLDDDRCSAWICDITNATNVNTIFTHKIQPFIDGECTIINLACPASPPFYQADPLHTTKTCVYGSINLLEIAREFGYKYMFTSTSEVYGDPVEHPQAERYNGNVNCTGVRSCYDEGKRCAESICFDYNRMYGVDVRVVRLFNTYGPYMRIDDGRCVSAFINQALSGDEITVYGDGTQTRSMCYVDDIVDGLIKMLESREIGPINLGNPTEMRVVDIARYINSMVNCHGRECAIKYCDLPSDDPKMRKPDITKARETLGWEPKVTFVEGINKTIKYFRNLK